MPLSASFGFFSPFHYKKKTYISIALQQHQSFFSSSLLFFLHFRESRLATIFIMLPTYLKITKIKNNFIAIGITHKYFIQNKLEL